MVAVNVGEESRVQGVKEGGGEYSGQVDEGGRAVADRAATVARSVARSFKTVDGENYYGPMYDSTVLCEWPKREGGMSTYVSVAGLQPHQIWGGVVARPLHCDSLAVAVLHLRPP